MESYTPDNADLVAAVPASMDVKLSFRAPVAPESSLIGHWLQSEPNARRLKLSFRFGDEHSLNSTRAIITFTTSGLSDAPTAELLFPLESTKITTKERAAVLSGKTYKKLRGYDAYKGRLPPPHDLSTADGWARRSLASISADPSHVATRNLHLLTQEEQGAIAAALTGDRTGGDADADGLYPFLDCWVRFFQNADHKLWDAIHRWDGQRSLLLAQIISGHAYSHAHGSHFPIAINWNVFPPTSNLPIPSRLDPGTMTNFSTTDLVCRKLGAMLNDCEEEARSIQRFNEARFDYLGVKVVHGPSPLATDRLNYVLAIVHPVRELARDLEPGTSCLVMFPGESKGFGAVCQTPFSWMQSEDFLLKIAKFKSNLQVGVYGSAITAADAATESLREVFRNMQEKRQYMAVNLHLAENVFQYRTFLDSLECLANRLVPQGDTSNERAFKATEYHERLLELATCRTPLVFAQQSWMTNDAIRTEMRSYGSDRDIDFAALPDTLRTVSVCAGIAIYILEGLAGSGKTSWIARLLHVISCIYPQTIFLTAPSNAPIDAALEKVAGELTRGAKTDTILVRGHTSTLEKRDFDCIMSRIKDHTTTAAFREFTCCSVWKSAEVDKPLSLSEALYGAFKDVFDDPSSQVEDASFVLVEHSSSRTLLKALGLHRESSRNRLWNSKYYEHDTSTALLRAMFGYVKGCVHGTDFDLHESLMETWLLAAAHLVLFVDILATTPAVGCSSLYKNFKASLAIFDESNKCAFAEWLAVCAHTQPRHIILAGDRCQLEPSHKQRSHGYEDSLISPLVAFAGQGIRVNTLFLQRRAAHGLVDIPFRLFYRREAQYIARSKDLVSHHTLSEPCASLVTNLTGHYVTPQLPCLYINTGELRTSNGNVLTTAENVITRSKRMVEFVNIGVWICIGLIRDQRIVATDLAIICPYKEQLRVYRDAFVAAIARAERTNEADLSALNHIHLYTIDQCEGSEVKVVIFDTTSTHALGFSAAASRLLVALTRATDCLIVIGQPGTLGTRGTMKRSGRKALLFQVYVEAEKAGAVWIVPHNHRLYEPWVFESSYQSQEGRDSDARIAAGNADKRKAEWSECIDDRDLKSSKRG